MDGFWRDILQRLGASPVENRPDLLDQLINTLRKRLKQPAGSLRFETEDEIYRLSREALRIGRMYGRERRRISYSEMRVEWLKIVDDFLKENPAHEGGNNDDDYYRDEKHLVHSVQYLCESEVLFQGREWVCRACFYRNWVSIEALGRSMNCEVCGRHEPPAVSGDWDFRANPFVIDAYRDSGTEMVIWALWQLSERAQTSFYFAPSLRLWFEKSENCKEAECDAEIDSLAVVDGDVYMIEATRSERLSDSEIFQLSKAAERIRPDTMLVACMPSSEQGLANLARRVEARMPGGIRTEVLAFDPSRLELKPYLPH